MLFLDDHLPLLAYQHTLIRTTMRYFIMARMQIKNNCCLAYLGSPIINQLYLFTDFPFESVIDL
jgi:hypothetical protein